MSADPSTIGFSTETIGDCFDAIGAPWWDFGIAETGPMFAIRDRNEYVQWADPSAQTVNIDYGRQRPLITLAYFITNAIPIYTAMGVNSSVGGVHTCTLATETGALPEYHFRMQESGGIVNTIVEQYNCKTHTLKLTVDRLNPMQAVQIIMGTDRWVADNTYWQDGATPATSYTSLMDAPSLYTGTSALGFYLDPLSEITVNGVDIADHVIRMEASIAQLPTMVYTTGNTFQEEIFPSAIFETNPLVPLGIDIDCIVGVENTLIKDIMESSAFTVSAKMYSDKAQSYYTHWNFASSAKFNEAFISIPNPENPQERVQRMRFMCDHTSEIKTVDGITTLPTFGV